MNSPFCCFVAIVLGTASKDRIQRDALSTIPEIPHPICWKILDIQQVVTVGSWPFDTVSVRLNSAFLHDAIALAEHDDAGLPVLDLMFGDVGEAHDGEDVTSFSLEGSRAVEDDLARTGIAGDGVGLEAISVCHIAAQNALVRYEPAFLHQVVGDGQAAFVLQIAICDCGAVNLRF